MDLTIKHVSETLRNWSGDGELERASSFCENHDLLYFGSGETKDDYFIHEMSDGRFYAASNGDPDDTRDFDTVLTDLDCAEIAVDGAGLVQIQSMEIQHYYGAYFSTLEEAVKAVQGWMAGKPIPKEYHKPIVDGDLPYKN